MADTLTYAGLASTLGGLLVGAIGLAYGLHNKVNEAAVTGLKTSFDAAIASAKADLATAREELARIDQAQKDHEAKSASKEAMAQLRDDLKGALADVKTELKGMNDRFASKESVEHVRQDLQDVKGMVRDLQAQVAKDSRELLAAVHALGRNA